MRSSSSDPSSAEVPLCSSFKRGIRSRCENNTKRKETEEHTARAVIAPLKLAWEGFIDARKYGHFKKSNESSCHSW